MTLQTDGQVHHGGGSLGASLAVADCHVSHQCMREMKTHPTTPPSDLTPAGAHRPRCGDRCYAGRGGTEHNVITCFNTKSILVEYNIT